MEVDRLRVPQRQLEGEQRVKITGLNKATDVTMKRGVIGSLNLYNG